MSIRIYRAASLNVDGDGSATSVVIDLREQVETKDLVGDFSPSDVENVAFVSNRNGTPTTVSSSSISQFVLTVNLASAPASDPQFGYKLSFNLLVDGEK